MNKVKKSKLIKVSKTPPPGWPTEKEWAEIEKKLDKSKQTKILASDASPVDRAKHELCAHFIRYCQEKNITQRQLAEILGVSESRVSEIVHYHHGRFTIDKLLELLNIIKPKLKFKVA
ncbi:MAG: XRE family transcriptional regulator [Pseudobdellovibrionaceae bacterium]|jgi:predicted XRE-type DNA-binding protein